MDNAIGKGKENQQVAKKQDAVCWCVGKNFPCKTRVKSSHTLGLGKSVIGQSEKILQLSLLVRLKAWLLFLNVSNCFIAAREATIRRGFETCWNRGKRIVSGKSSFGEPARRFAGKNKKNLDNLNFKFSV